MPAIWTRRKTVNHTNLIFLKEPLVPVNSTCVKAILPLIALTVEIQLSKTVKKLFEVGRYDILLSIRFVFVEEEL